MFRAVKDGSPTHLSHMMSDLGVRMAFANTSQAKGRVEPDIEAAIAALS